MSILYLHRIIDYKLIYYIYFIYIYIWFDVYDCIIKLVYLSVRYIYVAILIYLYIYSFTASLPVFFYNGRSNRPYKECL